MGLHEQISALAERQHGLVSSDQLAAAGGTHAAIVHLCASGRWERVAPRVIRLVGSPRSDGQRALSAVLAAGRIAALSHSAAARWWRIPGNTLDALHVVVQRDHTRQAGRGRLIHECELLPPEHVVVLDGVPVVVPARALFEVAGMRRRAAEIDWWVERIARMVDTAWSKGLVSGATLHAMLDLLAARGRSGTRVMRLVLATRPLDYVPPASGLESRFAQILQRAGEAEMRRQIPSGDEHTWIGRVDFRDPALPLVVEVQSERFHSSLIDKQLDRRRIERLRTAGYEVVEVTDVDVWHRPDRVLDMVRLGRREAALRVAA